MKPKNVDGSVPAKRHKKNKKSKSMCLYKPIVKIEKSKVASADVSTKFRSNYQHFSARHDARIDVKKFISTKDNTIKWYILV